MSAISRTRSAGEPDRASRIATSIASRFASLTAVSLRASGSTQTATSSTSSPARASGSSALGDGVHHALADPQLGRAPGQRLCDPRWPWPCSASSCRPYRVPAPRQTTTGAWPGVGRPGRWWPGGGRRAPPGHHDVDVAAVGHLARPGLADPAVDPVEVERHAAPFRSITERRAVPCRSRSNAVPISSSGRRCEIRPSSGRRPRRYWSRMHQKSRSGRPTRTARPSPVVPCGARDSAGRGTTACSLGDADEDRGAAAACGEERCQHRLARPSPRTRSRRRRRTPPAHVPRWLPGTRPTRRRRWRPSPAPSPAWRRRGRPPRSATRRPPPGPSPPTGRRRRSRSRRRALARSGAELLRDTAHRSGGHRAADQSAISSGTSSGIATHDASGTTA